MFGKITTSIIFTVILILIAIQIAITPTAQAMRRESKTPVPIEGEIVEGRSVIVNVPGKRGYTFILEV